MPRDAVSRTENVERNGGHKWVNTHTLPPLLMLLGSVGIAASNISTAPEIYQWSWVNMRLGRILFYSYQLVYSPVSVSILFFFSPNLQERRREEEGTVALITNFFFGVFGQLEIVCVLVYLA